VAAYSAGDTISRDEALSLIASLFAEDPIKRLNPATLAELLNVVTAAPTGERGVDLHRLARDALFRLRPRRR
jgi:hypothetical protein